MPAAHPRAGRFEVDTTSGERVYAFVPHPLPPEPPPTFDPRDQELVDEANRALGRLDGIGRLLPATDLFVYFYVRKEAVLSSQIEGTQSSLSELLQHENGAMPGALDDDVKEVSRYVAAMNHGLERIREGFPLSLRLIREMHERLMIGARGGEKQAGEFRVSQNWIGGTRPGNAAFVPPPASFVPECLYSFEKFLHGDPVRVPILLRTALAHVQFETIHPFLDGNGRLGRLLVPLLLCHEKILEQPTLYLSLYFRTHRAEYYRRLQAVREEGDWEGWIRFFMEGIVATAQAAVASARSVLELFDRDRKHLQGLGRNADAALRVHEAMQRRAIARISTLKDQTGLSVPTVTKALDTLEKHGVVKELSGRKRDRIFAYDAYLALLNEGTTLGATDDAPTEADGPTQSSGESP